jgi:hypothetical protein
MNVACTRARYKRIIFEQLTYKLLILHRNAYAVKDDSGNTIYFNLCGDLGNLTEVSEFGCPSSAASCIYTESGDVLNGGLPTTEYELSKKRKLLDLRL